MVRKLFLGLLLLIGCRLEGLPPPTPTEDLHTLNAYSEYWQQFFWTQWKNDSFALGTYAKFDTKNHMRGLRAFQISEQLAFNVSKNFSLEVHYTYLHGRSIVENSLWKWQHRLELEANRTFHPLGNCLIQTRNRLEIRREQYESKALFRLRQRTMFVIPIKKYRNLTSFSIYNELFYDLSTRRFTQDRICPCQLTFALSEKIELELFFLVCVFKSNAIWHRSAVLGTQLNF